MASKKETLDFVLTQLNGIENIKWRKMMGEYLIYYREKVVAGIYDDRFLVKLTPSSKKLLPDATEEPPYEGAKPMLSLSDLIFDEHSGNDKLLKEVFESIYREKVTEEENIFAGRLFDARTKELRDIKHKAHELCRQYNQMDEYDKGRLPIIHHLIGCVGEHFYFQGPIQFNYGSHTFIGNNFFANFNLTVMDDAPIFIGDNVMFGPNVSLMATNHPLIAKERVAIEYPDGHVSMSEFAEDIHIGNNVWLAANVVVLGGVCIGDGAVIGAGSVVTRDIPAGYVAFGSPCKPIRAITEKDSRAYMI